jgi:hypothetical protein
LNTKEKGNGFIRCVGIETVSVVQYGILICWSDCENERVYMQILYYICHNYIYSRPIRKGSDQADMGDPLPPLS